MVQAPGAGRGGEQAAKRVVASMGISLVDERLARSAAEAVDAASFRKTVVLKIASAAI
jgi:hypothetical protein